MKPATTFKLGLACSCVSMICCFTPVLVFLLSALGLSALTGRLDDVLLPALGISLVMTGYGLIRLVRLRRRRDAA